MPHQNNTEKHPVVVMLTALQKCIRPEMIITFTLNNSGFLWRLFFCCVQERRDMLNARSARQAKQICWTH